MSVNDAGKQPEGDPEENYQVGNQYNESIPTTQRERSHHDGNPQQGPSQQAQGAGLQPSRWPQHGFIKVEERET